jgi:hypothetical protein
VALGRELILTASTLSPLRGDASRAFLVRVCDAECGVS